jgi:hypothetical protein
MVYDASKCKLNEAVWAPNFFMSSPDSLLNSLESGTYMGDIDLGEFFFNFPLDIAIRPYAGVDLTPYFGENAKLMWERWLSYGLYVVALQHGSKHGMGGGDYLGKSL